MISYEDLDKALTRWKARRAGPGSDQGSETVGDANAPGMVVETVAFETRESTGELDFADAVLDEG